MTNKLQIKFKINTSKSQHPDGDFVRVEFSDDPGGMEKYLFELSYSNSRPAIFKRRGRWESHTYKVLGEQVNDNLLILKKIMSYYRYYPQDIGKPIVIVLYARGFVTYATGLFHESLSFLQQIK